MKIKTLLDPDFQYTRSDQMSPDYLRDKFARMERERKKAERERVAHQHSSILKMRA